MVYLRVCNVLLLAIWFVVGIFPKAWICAWNHHHQHLPPFRHSILNRLLEFMYGFQTGAISNLWVLHHVLGHHQHYLNPDLDENRWKRPDGQPMTVLEYTVDITLTSYPRALRVGTRFPRQRRVMVVMGLATTATLACLISYKPVNALFVFVTPMATSLFLTGLNTYYQHRKGETHNEFEASYNITHRWFNILMGNMGYHTAHHIQPGLHWSRLRAFHQSIAHRIPRDLYLEPGIPYSWMGRTERTRNCCEDSL
jgi:fatty acid desaturase